MLKLFSRISLITINGLQLTDEIVGLGKLRLRSFCTWLSLRSMQISISGVRGRLHSISSLNHETFFCSFNASCIDLHWSSLIFFMITSLIYHMVKDKAMDGSLRTENEHPRLWLRKQAFLYDNLTLDSFPEIVETLFLCL